MTPETEGKLLRDIAAIASGVSQVGDLAVQVGKVEQAMRDHDVHDQERHEDFCERLEKVENKLPEIETKVTDITGELEVAGAVKEAVAKIEGQQTAAEEKKTTAQKLERNTWLRLVAAALLGGIISSGGTAATRAMESPKERIVTVPVPMSVPTPVVVPASSAIPPDAGAPRP